MLDREGGLIDVGVDIGLVRKAGAEVAVLNPRTPSDPTFLALLAAISRRLDADRGYRTR